MFKDIRKRMSKTLEKKALPPLPSQRPQQQQQQQKKGGTSPSPSSPSLNTKKSTHRTSSTSTASLSITSTPASPTTPQRAVSAASLMSIGSDPLLDHSHLKPGDNASLLSYSQTINMYRENAKKSNNADIQCDFAIFLVEAAKRLEQQQEERQEEEDDDEDDNNDSDQDRIQQGGQIKQQQDMHQAYLTEAEKLLKVASLRGHRESQHYLANMYAAGLLCKDGRPDFDKAFPLFVQAAKHHDPDAAFRTGKCYEDGLGTRRDRTKAAQYYKKAASLNHPGAMYRLGLAEMNGELGMTRNLRDGHKWLKRSAEAATPQYPHALHELALLHEKGFDSVIFVDTTYAVHLYSEAAALGYAPSAFRLGECYEFGRLGCTKDASLSIRYYSIAADQGHPDACFALAAWYLMGAQDVLEASEQQAFAWAYRAALQGLPKAEYAIGYFYEVGIGVAADAQEAVAWYERAAAQGERRAAKRLHQMPARYRSSYTATQTNKAIPARLPSALQLHGEELLQRAKGLLTSKKESGPIANFV